MRLVFVEDHRSLNNRLGGRRKSGLCHGRRRKDNHVVIKDERARSSAAYDIFPRTRLRVSRRRGSPRLNPKPASSSSAHVIRRLVRRPHLLLRLGKQAWHSHRCGGGGGGGGRHRGRRILCRVIARRDWYR